MADDDEPKIDVLAKQLAGAEVNYRNAFEQHGPHSSEAAERWIKMRDAGNAIRQYFFEREE